MSYFHVSVIAPVYKAAIFMTNAVESAIRLEEVGEVILIEDGSPDNAIEILKKIASENPKVRLYQHQNGENKGVGAIRNLGIEKSKYEFVAFLDADDWYLANRFEEKKALISKYNDAAGIYGLLVFFIRKKDY